MSRLIELATEAERLRTPDKLWLIERLARSVRQDSESPRLTHSNELRAMADDPQIRRALAETENNPRDKSRGC